MDRNAVDFVELLKPQIFIDGDKWCVLHGEDLHVGTSAFGSTLAEAVSLFNEKFRGSTLRSKDIGVGDKIVLEATIGSFFLDDETFQLEPKGYQAHDIICVTEKDNG